MSRLRILCCLAVAACASEGTGDDDDDDVAGPDAAPGGGDAGGPDGATDPCEGALPGPSPSWLGAYQDDIVARLSGHVDIAPGVRLADRATATRRQQTRTYLAAELAALGYAAEQQAYAGGANVYATLASTEGADSTVVVGAHFDSVPGSPGANDNATGVAMVLSAARYLRDLQCRRHAVTFAFFDEEEDGLVGSYYFASMLASAGADVAAVHTIDQMGWDSNMDRLMELELPDGNLHAQYTDANAAGGFGVPIALSSIDSTDHRRFRDAGFAAVGLTEGYQSGDTTPYYHLPGDTYATVRFAYLASSTQLLHLTLARSVRTGERAAAAPPAGPMPPFQPYPGCRADHARRRAATRARP